MSLPHIIILTPAYKPFVGGAEIATEEVLLRAAGRFTTTVITARLSRSVPVRENINGVSVLRVGFGLGLDKWLLVIGAWWYIRKIKKEHKVSLLWAIMASYGGAAARIAQALTGISYVLTLQEGDALADVDKKVRPLRSWFDEIFQGACGIQVIAPFLENWAKEHGATAPITVIPNGVTCSRFAITPEEKIVWRRTWRKSLNIAVDAPVVLTVSRLVKKNGLHDLIYALKNIPTAHGIIVGHGPLEKELHEYAQICGGRIHFIGTQPQEELKKIAAAADIFCRPSWSEGLGIVFLEAMCMDLPVVATRVGGIPFIVRDGENGILVPPHDSTALAAAFRDLFDNGENTKQLRLIAREGVSALEWDIVAEKVIAWLLQYARLTPVITK